MLLPPGKKSPVYQWPVEKCDVIPHLHKVTGRILTGQFFNRPITVALKILWAKLINLSLTHYTNFISFSHSVFPSEKEWDHSGLCVSCLAPVNIALFINRRLNEIIWELLVTLLSDPVTFSMKDEL